MDPRVASSAGFGPSALWLADAVKKHGTRRFLLAPIETEEDAGRIATGLAEALASTLGLRVMVVNGADSDHLPAQTALVDVVSLADRHGPSNLEDLLKGLTERADVILYLGKPLLGDPESLIVARTIPHVIVAAEAGRTSRPQIERLLQLASREGFTIVGSVFVEPHRYIPRWLDRWFQ